ncbi:hypothetical protein [Rubritalea tangerina]|uniref:hypothetical protein n=1 Tax=Rubritalea tangerina TaxID=430798 RepID=UPI00360E0E13
MIYCLRIEGWKWRAELNRGQRLGAASCSIKLVYSMVSNWMEDYQSERSLIF